MPQVAVLRDLCSTYAIEFTAAPHHLPTIPSGATSSQVANLAEFLDNAPSSWDKLGARGRMWLRRNVLRMRLRGAAGSLRVR